MWVQAFPGVDPFGGIAGELGHHEKSWTREETDRLERLLRKRLAQPWRRLDPKAITCPGAHDGKPVLCRFAPGALRAALEHAGPVAPVIDDSVRSGEENKS